MHSRSGLASMPLYASGMQARTRGSSLALQTVTESTAEGLPPQATSADAAMSAERVNSCFIRQYCHMLPRFIPRVYGVRSLAYHV